MVFGVQALPVRSALAPPEFIRTPFFSLTRLLTASATPEFGVSVIMSTFSTSIHCRAILTPMSGLFWWSPESRSIFQPLAWSPGSAIAIFAATTEFGPPMSA